MMHHAITSLSRGTKVKASKHLNDDMPYILDWTKANITHSVVFCQTCKQILNIIPSIQKASRLVDLFQQSIFCYVFFSFLYFLCWHNQNKTFDFIAFEIYNVRKWKNCVRIYVPLPPLLNFCDFILHSAFHIALRTKIWDICTVN